VQPRTGFHVASVHSIALPSDICYWAEQSYSTLFSVLTQLLEFHSPTGNASEILDEDGTAPSAQGVGVVEGCRASFLLMGADLVLTCVKDGYVSSLRPIETAATDMDNSGAPLVTAKSGSPRPDLGIAYDDANGAVSFFTLLSEDDGGLVLPLGVTVSLSPSSGDGPFFTNAENLFERSATSTVGGLGFFFNLAPGDYELTFDDPRADCAPISFPFGAFGYPAPPTSVKFPIRAGFVTDQVGVLCTPKSDLSGLDAGARDR